MHVLRNEISHFLGTMATTPRHSLTGRGPAPKPHRIGDTALRASLSHSDPRPSGIRLTVKFFISIFSYPPTLLVKLTLLLYKAKLTSVTCSKLYSRHGTGYTTLSVCLLSVIYAKYFSHCFYSAKCYLLHAFIFTKNRSCSILFAHHSFSLTNESSTSVRDLKKRS